MVGLRGWTRFTTRQVLLLAACVAVCIAVNRDRDPGEYLGLVTPFVVGFVIILLVPSALTILDGLFQRQGSREPPRDEPCDRSK
jgi:hypothetical protein